MTQKKNEPEPESVAVGLRITEARTRKGWTQQQFAQAAQVSISTVQRWEKGHIPPHPRLHRIAAVLDIDPEEIGVVQNGRVDHLAEIRQDLAEVRAMVQELLDR